MSRFFNALNVIDRGTNTRTHVSSLESRPDISHLYSVPKVKPCTSFSWKLDGKDLPRVTLDPYGRFNRCVYNRSLMSDMSKY